VCIYPQLLMRRQSTQLESPDWESAWGLYISYPSAALRYVPLQPKFPDWDYPTRQMWYAALHLRHGPAVLRRSIKGPHHPGPQPHTLAATPWVYCKHPPCIQHLPMRQEPDGSQGPRACPEKVCTVHGSGVSPITNPWPQARGGGSCPEPLAGVRRLWRSAVQPFHAKLLWAADQSLQVSGCVTTTLVGASRYRRWPSSPPVCDSELISLRGQATWSGMLDIRPSAPCALRARALHLPQGKAASAHSHVGCLILLFVP
jgi:hypothetical protein